MQCSAGHNIDGGKSPDRGGLEIVFVDDDPKCLKACHYRREGETIRVNPSWWAQINDFQRAFTLAHESAHVDGVDCERCADLVAGKTLKAWGFSLPATKSAAGVVKSRASVAIDAANGWAG